jgi:sialidase-1
MLTRLLFVVILFLSGSLYAQRTEPWKGFEKVHFDFQGRKAWYIRPAIPLEGKPWVWRAHFPDWHTTMDSILVSRGFHIAYVNTNDLFGHPSSLLVWDDFYHHLTTQQGFSAKVALEAVSRGGLYAYGWAKRNPEKVSCIYAEAPVCDPRSWPGGKGTGKGSPEDWAKWLALFGLSEQEAGAFRDIPLEGLDGLAAFKVPILHVVGPNDRVVPNEENTFKLVENYMRAGGPATVYTLSRSEQKLDGHHFDIEHPHLFADYIQQHSYPVAHRISSQDYIQENGGLGRAFEVFKSKKVGTVAFLGGSITHNPGWRTKTIQYLEERLPETQFNFISAGIPSLGSTPHAFRFRHDVLAQGIPDLLFVESAVNDRTNGFSEKAQIRALEGIIQQAKQANKAMDIVVMAFADPDKTADWEKQVEPTEVLVHEKVARHYGAPFINLAREVYDRTRQGEFSWTFDFKDLHPAPFGQEIYFSTLKTLFRSAENVKGEEELPTPLDQFSYKGGRYESVNHAVGTKGFALVERWRPSDGKGTRKGFVDVPMLVGETEGATFDLPFKGKGVGIALVSGPDAGAITYRIDGKKERTVDLSTQWSGQLHLPWYLVLEDELKSGNHRLTVTIKPGSQRGGSACRIVHFLILD